jgi:hypothetical protein
MPSMIARRERFPKSEDQVGWVGGSGGAVGAHPIDSHAAGPRSLDRRSFAGARASLGDGVEAGC